MADLDSERYVEEFDAAEIPMLKEKDGCQDLKGAGKTGRC